MNLQDEYANPSAAPADAQQQPQGQDITLPAAAVAQITQALQQKDCNTVCQIMTQLIAGGGNAENEQAE